MGPYSCGPECTCGRHAPSRRHHRTGSKSCTKCREEKSLTDDFDVAYQGKRGPVYHARCKQCRVDDSRERQRSKNIRGIYGLSLEEYDRLFSEQNGVCAICENPERANRIKSARSLSVDHDHVTGRIRGLLCSNCNRAIGLLSEDVNILKRAIDYLE